jgi:hypothetical protein
MLEGSPKVVAFYPWQGLLLLPREEVNCCGENAVKVVSTYARIIVRKDDLESQPFFSTEKRSTPNFLGKIGES